MNKDRKKAHEAKKSLSFFSFRGYIARDAGKKQRPGLEARPLGGYTATPFGGIIVSKAQRTLGRVVRGAVRLAGA